MFFSFRVCRCCILPGYFIGYSASSFSKLVRKFSLKIMDLITQLKLLYKLTPSSQTKGLVINYKGSRVAGRNSCFGIGAWTKFSILTPAITFDLTGTQYFLIYKKQLNLSGLIDSYVYMGYWPSSINTVRVANHNHSTRFGSSCPLAELVI